MKTTNKRPLYEAYVILSNWRYAKFGERTEQQEAFKFLTENGISVELDDGKIVKDNEKSPLELNDTCLPIRIMFDASGLDFSDDWTFSSPISEIKFNGICRWWPKKWLYTDEKVTLPEEILIHYGPVDIRLLVVKPSDDVMKKSFADVIIEHDKTQIGAYDQSIDRIKQTLEKNMFGKNKKKESEVQTVVDEEKIEPTEEIPVDVNPIEVKVEPKIETTIPKEEIKMEEVKTEAKVEETTKKEGGALASSKKKFSKAKLAVGIFGTAAALAGAGFVAYKIFKAKQSGATTPEA